MGARGVVSAYEEDPFPFFLLIHSNFLHESIRSRSIHIKADLLDVYKVGFMAFRYNKIFTET
jgi:hypothetical protein